MQYDKEMQDLELVDLGAVISETKGGQNGFMDTGGAELDRLGLSED